MGCAKPELLRVSAGASTNAAAAEATTPVILGGGRLRNMDTSDILLWESPDGMGESWHEYSISYWHNRLAAANVSKFTKQMNSTQEPRQSSSYVSLLDAGPGEFVVVYEQWRNRHVPGGDTVFAMRVTVDSIDHSAVSSTQSASCEGWVYFDRLLVITAAEGGRAGCPRSDRRERGQTQLRSSAQVKRSKTAYNALFNLI